MDLIIYYDESDLQLGLNGFIQKLVASGRIGEYGVYILRSGVRDRSVTFDLEQLTGKRLQVTDHKIEQFKDKIFKVDKPYNN